MTPSSAPRDVRGHIEGSVYRAAIGHSEIYKFVSLNDPGGEDDHDCGIAVFHADSTVYIRDVLSMLKSERWKYSVVRRRRPTDDGVGETIVLRGPGKAGNGRVTIMSLPPNWRSVPSILLSKNLQEALAPYADLKIFQIYNP
jgi:hypothetical protein